MFMKAAAIGCVIRTVYLGRELHFKGMAILSTNRPSWVLNHAVKSQKFECQFSMASHCLTPGRTKKDLLLCNCRVFDDDNTLREETLYSVACLIQIL